MPSARTRSSLRLHPAGNLTITGRWKLSDPSGAVVDQSMDHSARTESRLHYILGAVVADVVVDAPVALVLRFSNGFALRVIDDDPRFEAAVLEPGDGRTTVV